MEDHHLSVKAYARARQVRIFGTVAIGGLLAVVGVLSLITSETWQSRFEQVFEPLPGLLYAPPTQDVALTTEDNPVPLSFQAIDRSDAYRYNASIPVSTEPLEPAAPFTLPASLSRVEKDRALNCLTQAVYYEAANESAQGQRAVAQVILNRMRHPAFPSSVCGVVYSGSQRVTGCQFTFTCDGSLSRAPSAGAWSRARQVAAAALSGYVEGSVGQATHYHALYVAPYWSPSLLKVANIGAHTFYRWKGWNGTRAAFVSPYAGQEPIVRGRTAADVAEDALTDIPVEPTTVVLPPIGAATPAPKVDGAVAIPEVSVGAPTPAPEIAPAAPQPTVRATPAAPPAEAVTATPGEKPRRRVARPNW
jgi:spore germination cell wall hydrolase CwlJ-like protein